MIGLCLVKVDLACQVISSPGNRNNGIPVTRTPWGDPARVTCLSRVNSCDYGAGRCLFLCRANMTVWWLSVYLSSMLAPRSRFIHASLCHRMADRDSPAESRAGEVIAVSRAMLMPVTAAQQRRGRLLGGSLLADSLQKKPICGKTWLHGGRRNSDQDTRDLTGQQDRTSAVYKWPLTS